MGAIVTPESNIHVYSDEDLKKLVVTADFSAALLVRQMPCLGSTECTLLSVHVFARDSAFVCVCLVGSLLDSDWTMPSVQHMAGSSSTEWRCCAKYSCPCPFAGQTAKVEG